MTPASPPTIDIALARGEAYRCVARACAFPTAAFGEILAQGLWLAVLDDAVGKLPPEEALLDALAALEIVQPTLDPAALAREYTRLFSNTGLTDCPPYGADYLTSHIFMRAQSLADVAGFYHAFGVAMGAGTERPDHISAELEFMGYLCWKEAYAVEHGLAEALEITRSAQRRFLEDHLGRWAPCFLDRFEAATTQPFYRAVAAFAMAFLAIEASWLGVTPEAVQEPPRETSLPGAFLCGDNQGRCPLQLTTNTSLNRSTRDGDMVQGDPRGSLPPGEGEVFPNPFPPGGGSLS